MPKLYFLFTLPGMLFTASATLLLRTTRTVPTPLEDEELLTLDDPIDEFLPLKLYDERDVMWWCW